MTHRSFSIPSLLTLSALVACSSTDHGHAADGLGSSNEAPDGAATGVDAAPAGTASQELAMETGTRSVDPGSEVYFCQDFPNTLGKDIAVVETYSKMTKGSHHLFTFMMPNSDLKPEAGLVDCPGGHLEFHDFMHASQTEEMTIPYPENVGRYLDANTGFRLMIHFLNVSDEAQDAFVKFRIKYVPPEDVEFRAATMFLNYVGVSVPPGKSTATASFEVPYDIHMIGALSHMHRRGVHFVASVEGGPKLFETSDWLEPVPVAFTPPIDIAKGQKITWSCDYENSTGETMYFGESAMHNEMCIFPGTFYGGDGSGLVPLIP